MRLELLTRPECHLCDDAKALLEQAGIAWEPVNIESSIQLLKNYGTRIPVIRDSNGNELPWPFDLGQLLAFWQSARG